METSPGAGSGSDSISGEPSGSPDLLTVQAETDHTSAVDQVDSIERRLQLIEQALGRLDDCTYSSCQNCGRDLDDAVLAEDPTTSTCVACAGESAPSDIGRSTLDRPRWSSEPGR